MNVDWAEFSKLLMVFIGGVFTAYITHLLSSLREKKKHLRDEKRDLRQIKIVGDVEIIGGPVPLPYVMQLVITAINIGYRPITIANAGVILTDDNGRTISQFGVSSDHIPWPSLPKTLGDGEALKFYMNLALVLKLAKEINKLSNTEWPDSSISSVFIKDAEGTEYTAEIPPDKMLMIKSVTSGEFPASMKSCIT